MTTLLFSSTILPPWLQTTQWDQLFASPTALPWAKPAGCPFALRALQSSRKPLVSFGNSEKPASFTQLSRWRSLEEWEDAFGALGNPEDPPLFPPVFGGEGRVADARERRRDDPAVFGFGIVLKPGIPTAVFPAQVAREVRHIEELVRVL